MTFLKKYAFGAVGFNFLLSSLAVLCAVIFVGVADQCGGGTCLTTIGIGLPLLIKSLSAAGENAPCLSAAYKSHSTFEHKCLLKLNPVSEVL